MEAIQAGAHMPLEGSEKVVATWNVWAVALALAWGVKLVRTIPGSPGGWTGFELDNSEGMASKAIEDWRFGRADVNARDFVEAFRDLQRMIHA